MVAARSIRIGVGLAQHPGAPAIPVSTLIDNFDDNSLGPQWTVGQIVSNSWTTTGCTVAETNQRLEVTLPASASNRGDGYVSVGTYSLSGDAAFVKVPNIASLQTGEVVRLTFGAGFNATIVVFNGSVLAGEANGAPGGSTSFGTDVWFRLRHDAPTDTLKIDTAPATASDPPATGDWVNRVSWTRDPTTILSGQVAFSVDANGTGPATPTTVQFDGFNTATTAATAITGSSTLTFTPTATLLGQGAITGSSTLLLSPAATLTGTGAVSGSSTLTFTPSGTVTGSGAITGSSTLTFAPSGALLGQGAVSGSSSLTFAPSGTLLGSGAISGTSALSFAPSATLLGKGAISGSSSLTFTGSATLAGTAQITGTTGLSFAPAGLLGGTGALTGSATLTLAGVGTVTSSNIWTVQPPAQGTWANDNYPVFDGTIFDPLLFGPIGPSWAVGGSTGSWTEQDAVAGIFDGVEFDPAIFDAPGAWSVVQPSTGTWG